MMTDTARLVKAARIWYDADCSLVPAAADGTKRPYDAWKQYQQSRASWPVVQAWLSSGQYDGFGIVCGKVSGNLEMFEIEGRAADLCDALGMRMIEHGYADLWMRLSTGYKERTPSGGYHWLYRVDGEVRGNLKLARRPADEAELTVKPDDTVKVLIETRGEGGFTIVAPSGGRTHPEGTEWKRLEGAPAQIPLITEAERDALHAIAATFDAMPAQEQDERRSTRPRAESDPLRPGDDYNLRADWKDILLPHGWTEGNPLGTVRTWTRPGKDSKLGISATTGRNDGDNLYVFSSAVKHFDTEKPYSKFAAYTLLQHGGNYASAAKELYRAGYGERHDAEKPDPFAGKTEPPAEDTADPEPEVKVEGDEEAFWTSRPELEHVRAFARARRCSPWAVLGVTLARVITATPPFVVLPALVGSYASLNLFVALVAPSGGGKGAAESAAGDCVRVGNIETATVGSGEGIGHLYAHRERGEVKRDRDAVLFTVPEVDNLSALGARQGATLMPQLRSAWSGERLGFSYADPKKALPIEKHTYRMGLILGVQPGRAEPLLNDADGGTPQRFLWMPTTDPDAPDEVPPCPDPLEWALQGAVWKDGVPDPFGSGQDLNVLPIPDQVRMQIGIASLSRLRSQSTDELDGHAMLARLKLATALGLFAGRRNVTLEDWALSEVLMAVSTRTRDSVVTYLSGRAKQANRQKGEAESQRAILVADRVAEEAVKRVARKILSRCRAADSVARSEVRRSLAGRDRQYFEEAVERLVDAGQVSVIKAENGDQLAAVR